MANQDNNTIPDNVADNLSSNDIVKLVRNIVTKTIRDEVPGAVDDAMAAPEGTYFSSTVMIAKTLSDVDRTTRSIQEDTKFIRNVLKKIEKKNEDLEYYLTSTFYGSGSSKFSDLLKVGSFAAFMNLMKVGGPLAIFASLVDGINQKEQALSEGKSNKVADARAAGEMAPVIAGAGLGSSFGPMGTVAGAGLGWLAGGKLDFPGMMENHVLMQQRRTKAATGTFQDKLEYFKHLQELKKNAPQPDNWPYEEEYNHLKADIQKSSGRVKDDNVIPKQKPLFGEFNLRAVVDDWLYPRESGTLSPTSAEEPISGSEMSPALSPSRILVANISDRKDPDNGQLVRVVSKQTHSMYLIKKLSGPSKGSQLTISGSKLSNFRELSPDTLSKEIASYEQSNARNDDLISGGSSTGGMQGSRGGDNLSASGSSFDIAGQTSPFNRIMGGSPNDPFGTYGQGPGYHSAGTAGPGRSYGSRGGGGGSGGASGYVPPASTKEMVYDPLSGKLIDPGPMGNSSELGKSTDGNMMAVYSAFLSAGFSDAQARALTAEVGRENDFNMNNMFGRHTDANNNKTNTGIFSWQGDRDVYGYLKSKGLVDKDGNIMRTQEALVAQAEFAKKEMETNPAYKRTLDSFLSNPNIDAASAFDILGHDYIRWDMDGNKINPTPHINKRNNYYSRITNMDKKDFTGNVMKDRTVSLKNEPTPGDGMLSNIKHERGNLKGVDPRLADVLDAAAPDLPEGYSVSMISGHDGRTTGTKNHPSGIAMDLQIYDKDGKPLPNNSNSPAWPLYERLYRSAQIRAESMYPGMKLIWGGTWQSKAAGNGDPMHYQVYRPDIKGTSTTMRAYDWDTGLQKEHDFYKSGNHMSPDEIKEWDTNIRKKVEQERMQATLQPVETDRTGRVVRDITNPPAAKPVAGVSGAGKDDEITELTTRLSDLEKKINAKVGTTTEAPNRQPQVTEQEVKEKENDPDLPTKVKEHTYNENKDPRLDQFAYA